MKIKPTKVEKEIEKAIVILVDCVKENCQNPKPLILHSVRVGMKLLELGQPEEIIIAGFLHDLIEDTDCKIGFIEKEFGQKIANLVLVLTQNNIKDYKKRWGLLLHKIKEAGEGAMIIKLVDNSDNLTHYLPWVKNQQIIQENFWKYHFTLESFLPYLANLSFFKKCVKNYKIARNNYKNVVKKSLQR